MTAALLADVGGPVTELYVFGGVVAAGIAATIGLALGGLWFARRRRRGQWDRQDTPPQ